MICGGCCRSWRSFFVRGGVDDEGDFLRDDVVDRVRAVLAHFVDVFGTAFIFGLARSSTM